MATDTLQQHLRRIEFLLILATSFLGGLVFGRDYGGEAFFAVVIFVGLTLMMFIIRKLESVLTE